MNTLSVNETKIVNNYPYGSLRTKATFRLEFDKKKGFRSVFQTVNPKNGRINNPKKGTYSDIMYMSDVDGFVKFHAKEFYKLEDFNKVTLFLSENFSLFTSEQISYLYFLVVKFLKLEVYALSAYCNVKSEVSLPFIQPIHSKAVDGMNNPGINIFSELILDHERIEALKDPNYSPFRISSV